MGVAAASVEEGGVLAVEGDVLAVAVGTDGVEVVAGGAEGDGRKAEAWERVVWEEAVDEGEGGLGDGEEMEKVGVVVWGEEVEKEKVGAMVWGEMVEKGWVVKVAAGSVMVEGG